MQKIKTFNKTKIVCSIGPTCSDVRTLEKMIDAGMSVARFNMSHGTHDSHKALLDTVRQARENRHAPVAILIDTKGPEIRIRQFQDGKVILQNGANFTLTTQNTLGTQEKVSVTYDKLPKILQPGAKILLNDGNIELCAEKISGKDVLCKVVCGGELSDNKSINLPGIKTEMPYLSAQDKKDLLFAKLVGADYIAISFVGCAQDVLDVKNYLREIDFKDAKIISKIESEDGVKNFDSILKCSDGIMVARGDLGVEVDFERIPIIQKRIIQKCNAAGKISITATQMLESMIVSPRPTRAEISDVANAIFDGSTAIMLSGETASGAHPVESVQTMRRIALEAENYLNEQPPLQAIATKNTSKSLGYAAFALSQTKGVEAIVAVTKSGTTAQNISRFRPQVPIVASTPSKKVFHKMAMMFGVVPILDKAYPNIQQVNQSCLQSVLKMDLLSRSDKIVLISGTQAGKSGTSNLSIKKL